MDYFKKRKEEHNISMATLHIVRAGKPHTIAESLIKPCITEIVRCMIGEEATKKIATVQCSNNTIFEKL